VIVALPGRLLLVVGFLAAANVYANVWYRIGLLPTTSTG
jgi:hypothetical protein